MQRWITVIFLFFFWFNPELFSQYGYRDVNTVKEDLNDSLLSAAYDGDFNRMIENINKGADVNAHDLYGQTPLMFVIENNDLKLVKMLVDKGANVNVKPNSYISSPPLIIAVKYGYLGIARYLLEHKADVSIKDIYGLSPIHFAAMYNDSALFDMLIRYHADIDAKTYTGETPLLIASYNGSSKIGVELLQKFADINASDNEGFTPLMVAAQNNQYEMVMHLLEGWASTHMKNIHGFSALSLAIANGNSEIVDLLLLNGANKNEENTRSLNPLAIAKIYNQSDIVDTLKKMHAKPNLIPYFMGIVPEIGIKFNDKDILIGVDLLTHDLKYNLDIGIHYYFRPSAIPVLIQKSENIYYQFWERRNILGLSLAKEFTLKVKAKKQVGLIAGVNGDLNFGYYRGTDISINANFLFTPFAGIYYVNKNFGSKISYSYSNYQITGLTNWYIGFSIMYRFKCFPKDRNKKMSY